LALVNDGILPDAQYVHVPHPGAWESREAICEEIVLRLAVETYTVVLLSAGFASNWIVDRLYDDCQEQISMLDVGAMWMPFVGKPIRKHHQRYIDDGMIDKSLQEADA
jgi:hypothetical protein